MNHRERVFNAIKHNKVDRVPFDFWAEKPTLERLYSFYGTRDLNKILEDFDVDILDPIRSVSPEMSPENLKEKFSKSICFHGEIDVQTLFAYGTPDEVKEGIARYLNLFGNDGGYICSPSHLFQPDIPHENIKVFYEAAKAQNLIDE